MIPPRPLVLGFAVALLGCTGPPRPASRDAVPTVADRDSLIASLHAAGRSWGESRVDITARLGRPREVHIRTLPNRHVDGAMDTAIALDYPERRFGLLRPGPTARDLLISAETWDPRTTLADVVRIGSTTGKRLRGVLGEPARTETRADSTILVYLWPPEGAEEEVRFHVVRDTLRLVSWRFYFD